ncbi:ATP-dependent DNA ligase [Sanguibacter suaedae]|nr:ATP-dependent DNA ligase [Sanguibacter suaedae]
MYPATGTTKADVLAYLVAVAGPLVAHAGGRPATRKRWVHGTDGPVFFQKHLDGTTPSWVRRGEIEHSAGPGAYPLVDDVATLTWLGQTAALEVHVPQWRFGPDGSALPPDRIVLDLDPGPGVGLVECAQVAHWAREVLEGMGLAPFPVTSGSKGIHLYAALPGTDDAATVRDVAHELARSLEADHPDLVVSDMKRSLRAGKVLVDWSQNSASKTTVAPYSLRGLDRPTVAAPRTWAELDAPDLGQLEADEVVARLARDGDLLAGLLTGEHDTVEAGGGTTSRGSAPPADRLAVYRSKRDASRTPEPVPDRVAPPSSSAPVFVIQEHHARRLHFDLRLERDGVLVSWALPRGEPTDPARNHLAVRTEDHPLEYATFAGTIPRGEYGAGEMTVWDHGTYETHTWRDDEVVVTLRSDGSAGTDRGTRRLALVRTGSDTSPDSWLAHRTKDARRAPAARVPALSPMLATAGTSRDVDAASPWAFEMKWDGIRAVVTVEDGRVRLTSRNGLDLTRSFPELAAVAGLVDGDAVLDGEVVALDGGRPDFGLLQTRIHLSEPAEVAAAQARQAVDLMVFDVLDHRGRRVTGEPYDARRELLARVVTEGGPVHVPPAFEADAGPDVLRLVTEAMSSSRELGLEGVVAKRRDSTYRPGRRARSWIKLKHERAQEVVVVGWRPGRGERTGRLGSLLVAVPGDDGALRYAGRVGSGLSDRTLDRLAADLGRRARPSPPLDDVPSADASDACWVTADLVGEITFAGWTATGRLRHPVWGGWRPDKGPADVRREG